MCDSEDARSWFLLGGCVRRAPLTPLRFPLLQGLDVALFPFFFAGDCCLHHLFQYKPWNRPQQAYGSAKFFSELLLSPEHVSNNPFFLFRSRFAYSERGLALVRAPLATARLRV